MRGELQPDVEQSRAQGEQSDFRGKRGATGDRRRTESNSPARRDERGAKRRAGGARLSGLRAMARTAGVVRQERDEAAAEHRGARRQSPAVW